MLELAQKIKALKNEIRHEESCLEESIFVYGNEDAYLIYGPTLNTLENELEELEALLEEEKAQNELELVYEEMGW